MTLVLYSFYTRMHYSMFYSADLKEPKLSFLLGCCGGVATLQAAALLEEQQEASVLSVLVE